MPSKQVCQVIAQDKAKLSSALSAGWGRVAHMIGKGKFADDAGFDVTTFNRALTGPSLPSSEHLLNSLAADPSALDEVFALFGLALRPTFAKPGNDMELASHLGRALAEYLDRLSDGKRCHNDTLALASLFRPLVQEMQAVIDEGDKIRGVV